MCGEHQANLADELCRAAEAGDAGRVAALLEAGAPVNNRARSRDRAFGFAPLALAAWNGNVETLRVLLGRGADVRLPGANGWTALHVAAGWGKTEAARVLLDAGADANASAPCGFTPLGMAIEAGHTPVVRLLLERGADTHARGQM